MTGEATNKVRAVVVKLRDDSYPEKPWIACCMSLDTWDVIGEEDWQTWKHQALPMVLADWQDYDIREVVLSVPQSQLDALFAVDEIRAEASS